MLFHGEDDNFVRFRDNGKVIYTAAPNPKELVLVQNAHHTNVPSKMGKENYLNKIEDWIQFSIEQQFKLSNKLNSDQWLILASACSALMLRDDLEIGEDD